MPIKLYLLGAGALLLGAISGPAVGPSVGPSGGGKGAAGGNATTFALFAGGATGGDLGGTALLSDADFNDTAATLSYNGTDASGTTWTADAGITLGCDPEGILFCPDDPVTRGQMAAFLHRALG